MVSWVSDGFLEAPGRLLLRQPTGSTALQGVLVRNTTVGSFANPGSVDAQVQTRLQYDLDSAFSISPTNLAAGAALSYTAAEKTANTNRFVALTLFIAPASSFSPGVTPTPGQIYALQNALRVFRSQPIAGRDITAGFSTQHTVVGPKASQLLPNTKYWALLVPTTVAAQYSTPSYTNDVPMASPATTPATNRAVSFWTNRTPSAPVITSPGASSLVNPGTALTFTIDSRDPDNYGVAPGDVRLAGFRDLAGVQVQYAPRPVPGGPAPTWQDLPIATTGSSPVAGRGWFIENADGAPANDGAKLFRDNQTMQIRCGSNTLSAGMAALPSGDWQIRVRTFDYGHPFTTLMDSDVAPPRWIPGYGPLGTRGPDSPTGGGTTWPSTAYNPDTYPATNTSPWSNTINIAISAQVPPPTLLSPINSNAIIAGAAVTLRWMYRNTFSPPFPQGSRSVRIRKVGDPWTVLATGASANPFLDIPGSFPLVQDNEYEWQVQTTDSSGVISNWSEIARFWIVAAPSSGATRPEAAQEIDGATLGCGKHRAFIYRRGGKRRVAEIKNFSYLDWGRDRDDISTAKIVVSDWDIDCGNMLSLLKCWAYEVVIFRNNGFSEDRVWEGPITLLTYETEKVTIHVKDVMGYAYRRILKQALRGDATDTVVNRAGLVLQNVFAADDPNVLAYLTMINNLGDASAQYRSTPAYSRTAFEEVDDMASNAGLDYTVVGRSILLWGTKSAIGLLPELTDKDLGSSPIVSEYGMSMANRYVVSDGNGIWGEATRLDVSGNDPNYGLVEMLSSTWADDTPEDTGTYTQEAVQTMIGKFAGYAERSISDRYQPGSPVVVRVPDNTTLSSSTVISIQQLVPGVTIPLRSVSTLRKVRARQKLDRIKVVEQGGIETITVTMSPFSRDDASAGEEIEE